MRVSNVEDSGMNADTVESTSSDSYQFGMVTLNAPVDELKMDIASYTDPAGRDSNEDAILATELTGIRSGHLLAVADGMGGYEHGEVASRLAIDVLQSALAESSSQDVAVALKQAYRQANQQIFEFGAKEGNAQPLGTTLVSAVVVGHYATIANIGDSRAYLFRANQLTQITQDHSVVGEQVAKGEITEDQARTSRQRNLLTASLGLSEILDRRLPSIYEIALLPEDSLLLCSDGFYDVLETQDYLGLLGDRSQGDVARQLTDLAKTRGTTDNVSAVVLRVSPSVAAVQRVQLHTELAEARPKTSALWLPIAAIILLIAIIAVGAWFYL
ncbi:MAG: protein phosphatase 2C domain-containing protein [Thermomicrobiales bacterium]